MEIENDMITALAEYSQPPPNLPDEIIIEILLRLPVKSLMKFKCVSKSWRCLISSNHFARAHLKISTNNNVYAHNRLIYGSRAFPMDLYTCSLDFAVDNFTTGCVYPAADENLLVDCVCIEYPIYQPGENCPEYEFDDVIWLVGSCHGLVCVSLSVITLIFWNPTTRESRVLSDSGTELNYDYYGITYGFGYDELHDDYKVVEFLSYDGGMGVIETQVKVYSLRSDSWKTLDNWPGRDTFGGAGKFINGAIHWSVSDFTPMAEWGVVAHDLATDTFLELPMPKLEDFDVRVEVKVLNGCLSICCEYYTYMDVWIMKEYGVGESWTRVYRFPFSLDLEEHEYIRPKPLSLMVDGKVLINYGTNLRIYDSRTPDVHQFGDSTEVEATTYVESLVSPNLYDGSNIENETDMITALAKYSLPLPNLPEEIITEILLRLPVKSLLKFRFVSKSWLALISSDQFVRAHLKISTKNNAYAHDRLIFGSKGYPMDLCSCSLHFPVEDNFSTGSVYPVADKNLLVDYAWHQYPLYKQGGVPSYIYHDAVWLVGSCNGLVCVSLPASTLMLWNPTTGEAKVLLGSGTDKNYHYFRLNYGFGYDELHDDYKVVEFFSFGGGIGEIEIQVKVYSLRTNSWKTLSNWPGRDTFGGTGKFLNGAIHWSVSDFTPPAEWSIVSHDLATDTFSELPMPKLEDLDVRVEVALLNGCLSVCCEYVTYMDVWIMKAYGVRESWTKVVRIPFSVNLDEHEFIRPSPVFLMTDGKVLINYGTNLRIYDPRTPDVHQFGKSIDVEVTTYVESLVSPNLYEK